NSYDILVDIELADAVTRLRFEHPEVSVVCIESAREDIFCAGANIYMLGLSSHPHKVNFCKFTNETRCNIEEATEKSGQYYVAAVSGGCAGGGYELALACAEIHLIDDRRSAVSLPEVPLLGVLPGTGGLTRLTDKRKVRRDLADVFCTTAEGVKGRRALEWKLVDYLHPSSTFRERVEARLHELAETRDLRGVELEEIEPRVEGDTFHYRYVTLDITPAQRRAKLTIEGPRPEDTRIPEDPTRLGSQTYALRMWRELADALLQLRFNYETVGVVTIHTTGDPTLAVALDEALVARKDHWFIREILLLQGRVLKMLDITARSFFALIEPGSAFAGALFEIALASDRAYMLDDPDRENRIALSSINAGLLPMANGLSRLENRFYGDPEAVKTALATRGEPLPPGRAWELGLVTGIPDDIDWEDETRVMIEERLSLSP
ncbi:MAG: benzoyl-CoA-dihydrodiol lyase, partial [Deltaproteobacteria bacterium]